MAPKFLMRVIREPQSGKAFEVVNAALAFRQQAGTTDSTVTMSVFSPITRVITAVPFDDMTAIEGLVDRVFSDPERQAAYDAIGALCNSVNINLSRVINPPDGIENAKWVRRYVFHHDTHSRRQLVGALMELNEHGDGPKVGITVSMNGPAVIATLAAQSLSEIEEANDRLENDAGTQARAAAVLAASTTWMSGIAKVMS